MINLTEVTLCNFFAVGQTPQTVDLAPDGLTLVFGHNADAGIANARNGVGKTTLAHAISYGLYGAALVHDINVDNMINNLNGRAMWVHVSFTRDGTAYRVERGRKPNFLRFYVNDVVQVAAPGVTDIPGVTETPVPETPGVNEARGGNPRQTQIEIDRVLGMSHLLFKHLVLLNTTTPPFLRAKPPEQREVIEELFGITQLSQRDEVLKARMVATKEVIRDAEATMTAIAEANARIAVAIAQATTQQQSWQQNRHSVCARLAAEIAALATVDFAAEIAVFDRIDAWIAADRELRAARTLCLSTIATIRRDASKLDAEHARQHGAAVRPAETALARLRADLAACQTPLAAPADIARLTVDRTRRQAAIGVAQQQIAAVEAEHTATLHAITQADGQYCVTCGQNLTGTAHLTTVLASLTATAARLSRRAEGLRQEVTGLQQEIALIAEDIRQSHQRHATETVDRQQRVRDLEAEIVAAQAAQDAQTAALAASRAGLHAAHADLLATLTAQDTVLQTIDRDHAALGIRPQSAYQQREDVWTLRAAVDTLATEQAREQARDNPHDATLAALHATVQPRDDRRLLAAQMALRHEDFLHRLLSSKESFIRKRIIDTNLGYLNRLLNKYLEALVLPHEVRFQPDLSVAISLFGHDYNVPQLSRGEMNRVILAIAWSFRDIWESLNTGFNLLLVDELADNGLDDAGAEGIITILQTMVREQGRSVFLISHKEVLIARVGRILMVHKEHQFTRFEANADI